MLFLKNREHTGKYLHPEV